MQAMLNVLSRLTEPGHLLDMSQFGEGPRANVVVVKPMRATSTKQRESDVYQEQKRSAVGEAREQEAVETFSTPTMERSSGSTMSIDSNANIKALPMKR